MTRRFWVIVIVVIGVAGIEGQPWRRIAAEIGCPAPLGETVVGEPADVALGVDYPA